MEIRIVLKKIIYFIIYYTHILDLLVIISSKIIVKHCALILFYHRFTSTSDESTLLSKLNIGEFKKQIEYINKFYDIISMDKMYENIHNRITFTKPSILITIDDGYKDNYSLAYPVLSSTAASATIYLTAGLIGTQSAIWLDDIEFALLNTRIKKISFPEVLEDELIDITTRTGKRGVMKRLYNALLPRNNGERKSLISRLYSILEVDQRDLTCRDRIMLTWDEVREMAGNGIQFGAHTLSHPFLPKLTWEDAQYEIKESRHIIEEQINVPVRHFAIPNGTRTDFTENLRNYCREIGFQTIVTTEGGTVHTGDDAFMLKRVLPPPPMYYFACEVAKYLFWSR
jgi:peptidoglycan/xylan/chitin deacetylase (PgdA/CDA1 family)